MGCHGSNLVTCATRPQGPFHGHSKQFVADNSTNPKFTAMDLLVGNGTTGLIFLVLNEHSDALALTSCVHQESGRLAHRSGDPSGKC